MPVKVRRGASTNRAGRWIAHIVSANSVRVGPSYYADLVLWGGTVPNGSSDTVAEFSVALHNMVAPGGSVVLINDRVNGARDALDRLGF